MPRDNVYAALRGAESIGAAPRASAWDILKKALTDPFGMGAGINALNEKRKALAAAILPDVVEQPLQQFADMAVQTPGSLGMIYAPVPRNLGDIDALKQRLQPRNGVGDTRTYPMPETTELMNTYVDRYPKAMSQIRRTRALPPAVQIGNRKGTGVRGQMGASDEAAAEFVRRIREAQRQGWGPGAALDTYNADLKAAGKPPMQLGLAEDVELLSPVQRHLVMAEELDHLGQWLKDPAGTMAKQNAYTQYLDYDLNPLEMRAKSAARARVGTNVKRASLPGERKGAFPASLRRYVDDVIADMTSGQGRETMPPVRAFRESLLDQQSGNIRRGPEFVQGLDEIARIMASNPELQFEFDLMRRMAESPNPLMRALLQGQMAEFNARGGRFAAQFGQQPGVLQVLAQLGIGPQHLGMAPLRRP